MLILLVLIVGVVLLYLLLWPVPVKPVKWRPPEAPTLDGDYAVNQALSAVELLPVGGRGPEDVIFDQQGHLYTGLEDGRIVRMQPDGTIYFSESSDRFPLHDYVSDFLESQPNGRLLAYDPEQGQTRLLLDDLYFANGIAVSPDQSYLLVAEGGHYRLQRYWLAGPRAGEAEIFIENLPGFPDNLHSNGRDIFWLAMVSPRKSIVDNLAGRPFLRKVIYRLPESLKPAPDQYGFVLGLDGDGQVIHNLQDPSGAFAETSGATEYEGMLYIGCLSGDAVGRLRI